MANKKNNAAALIACASFAFICASAALADEVVMANGDRISGKIIRKNGEQLVLKTPYAGELKITWTDIRRITTDGPITVYLEGGLTYVHTDYIAAPDDDYPAARWAFKFDHLLFDTGIQVFHNHEAYVNLRDAKKCSCVPRPGCACRCARA